MFKPSSFHLIPLVSFTSIPTRLAFTRDLALGVGLKTCQNKLKDFFRKQSNNPIPNKNYWSWPLDATDTIFHAVSWARDGSLQRPRRGIRSKMRNLHIWHVFIYLLWLLYAHNVTLLRFHVLCSTPFTQFLIGTRTVWLQMSPGQFRESFPVPRFGQPLTSLFILAGFLSSQVSNYKLLSKMHYIHCTSLYYTCLSIFLCRKLRFSNAVHPISSLPPLRSSCPWRQSNLPLASGSQVIFGSHICDI